MGGRPFCLRTAWPAKCVFSIETRHLRLLLSFRFPSRVYIYTYLCTHPEFFYADCRVQQSSTDSAVAVVNVKVRGWGGRRIRVFHGLLLAFSYDFRILFLF